MFYGMNAWFLASLAMGALWWIAIAAVPAWRAMPAAQGAAAFRATMARGGPVIALMLAGAAALGLVAAEDDADLKWAVGAGFLTLSLAAAVYLAMGPGKKLRALAEKAEQPEGAAEEGMTRDLLRVWAIQHIGRCLVVTTGVFFFIWAAH